MGCAGLLFMPWEGGVQVLLLVGGGRGGTQYGPSLSHDMAQAVQWTPGWEKKTMQTPSRELLVHFDNFRAFGLLVCLKNPSKPRFPHHVQLHLEFPARKGPLGGACLTPHRPWELRMKKLHGPCAAALEGTDAPGTGPSLLTHEGGGGAHPWATNI